MDCFQANNEGDLLEQIHKAPEKYQGIVINPGAFTHYSIVCGMLSPVLKSLLSRSIFPISTVGKSSATALLSPLSSGGRSVDLDPKATFGLERPCQGEERFT